MARTCFYYQVTELATQGGSQDSLAFLAEWLYYPEADWFCHGLESDLFYIALFVLLLGMVYFLKRAQLMNKRPRPL
jgi:hypothetical protein